MRCHVWEGYRHPTERSGLRESSAPPVAPGRSRGRLLGSGHCCWLMFLVVLATAALPSAVPAMGLSAAAAAAESVPATAGVAISADGDDTAGFTRGGGVGQDGRPRLHYGFRGPATRLPRPLPPLLNGAAAASPASLSGCGDGTRSRALLVAPSESAAPAAQQAAASKAAATAGSKGASAGSVTDALATAFGVRGAGAAATMAAPVSSNSSPPSGNDDSGSNDGDLYSQLLGGSLTSMYGGCGGPAPPLSCRPGKSYDSGSGYTGRHLLRRDLTTPSSRRADEAATAATAASGDATRGGPALKVVRVHGVGSGDGAAAAVGHSLLAAEQLQRPEPSPAPRAANRTSDIAAALAAINVNVPADINTTACAAVLRYDAVVGDPTQADSWPIFQASWRLTVASSELQPLHSWVLGWTFSAGERLLSSRDVFSGEDGPTTTPALISSVRLQDVRPGGGNVTSAQSVAVLGGTPLAASGAAQSLSMFGRRGPPAANASASSPRAFDGPPSAPLRIGPPSDVYLSGMACSPAPGLAKLARDGARASMASNVTASPPTREPIRSAEPLLEEYPRMLEVTYMPITLVSGADLNSSAGISAAYLPQPYTQFYVKLTNVGSQRALPLEDIQIQYWFEGPLDLWDPWGLPEDGQGASNGSSLASGNSSALLPPFQLSCSDTTPGLRGGCDAVLWVYGAGLPDVRGARYVLALGFAPGSGDLAPQSANSTKGTKSTAGSGPPQLPAVELILSIEPTTPARMDARQDYSYLDTPVRGQREMSQGATEASSGEGELGMVVLRETLPNARIPAYVDGILAWGSPPAPGPVAQLPSSPPAVQRLEQLNSQLPPNSACQEAGDGTLSCGLVEVYCCASAGPVVADVQPLWTQTALPNNTSADGNATDAQAGTMAGASANVTSNATAAAAPPVVGPVPAGSAPANRTGRRLATVTTMTQAAAEAAKPRAGAAAAVQPTTRAEASAGGGNELYDGLVLRGGALDGPPAGQSSGDARRHQLFASAVSVQPMEVVRMQGTLPSRGRRRLAQQKQSPPVVMLNSSTGGASSMATVNASACAVLLQYGAGVGDPTDPGSGPVFQGFWKLVPAAQQLPPIRSWALGWAFAAGERLVSSKDIFSDDAGGPGTVPANVTSATLQDAWPGGTIVRPFQSVAVLGNGTIVANGPSLAIAMFGRKGPPAADGAASSVFDGPSTAPLRIAPPSNVYLNNMACSSLRDLMGFARDAAARSGLGGSSGSPAPSPPPLRPPPLTQVAEPLLTEIPRVLEVSYMPITYMTVGSQSGTGAADANASAAQQALAAANESSAASVFFSDSFTQMYIKITNVGSRRPIPLETVQIQYFFEGPDESWSPPGASNESNGSSEPPFELKCSDTSAALPNRCGALAWLFSSGVPGVRGSRYVLALGFAPGSGNLAPQSANATNGTTSTNSTGGGETGAAAAGANPTGGAGGSESGSAVAGSEDEDIQLPAVELIISIEPTTPARMDARQDYSFLNTPILGQQQTSLKAPTSSGSAAPANASAGQGEGAPRIVMLRQRLPNPRIPAYVRGFIAWGSPPAPASQQPPEDLLPPPSEQQTSDMDALEEQLPPGSSCQKTPDGKLSCGVADSYCCATEGIIVTEVPPGWATIIAPPPSSPPPPPSSLPPPSPPPSPPPPPPPSSSAPSPDRPPLSSNGNVTARANGTGGGGGGNSARTAAIAVGVSLGTVALFLGVGLYAYLRPDCGGGRGHGGRGRRGDDVRRRFGRTAGGGWRLPHFAAFLLPAGLKRSDSAGSGASSGSSSSRSSSSSTSPSTSPSDSRSTGRSRGGDAHWRGVLRDLHRLQQQQPCLVSTNIHVTASEASELRYVLDAGWWQDNFASKGGPMGQQGLLPKYPTMPAEVFMAHVEALSPPTTRELREQLARGPICSGGGVGSQEGGGGVSGQGEGAGSEGVEGSGVQRKRSRAAAVAAAAAAAEAEAEGGRGWAAATLAAADLAGLDDDDIRLRILVRKAKTWTGRVDETWELLPDYPPHLLLPPMQQPEVAELELQAASVPDGQTAGEISGGAGAVPHPPQAPGAPLERTQPLLSRLLPRRRTLAAPMESPPAPSPPAALSKHHHHRRRPTLNRDMGAPSPGSPLAAGTTAAGIELQPRQPQAAQAQLHHHPGGPEPLGASRYITLDKVASLARGAGGGAGVAVLPGLPVSLSMAPIELDVDFETEVAPHLGRLVGVGGFGRVYEGTWRGRKVAVKTVTIDNEAQRQALAKEAQMCARFRNCERIVQLLGASLGLGPSAANSPPAGAGTGGVFRRTTRGGTEISSGGGAIPAAPAPDASAAFGSTTSRRGQGSSDGRGSSGAEPVPTGAETYATSGMGTPGRPAYQPTSRPAQQQQAGAQGQGHPGQQNAALIMELCEGGNLGGRIHHPHMRRLEYLEVLQLSRDVAEGLAHIHRFGVLHRDLKPGNVLLDSGGRAKIADFGISRLRDPYKSCVNVTQQGGTPNYMAPELFNGTRVDERADLYSLGCIMYEALTRKVPFDNLVRGPAAGQGPGGGEGGGGPDGMPAPLPMGGLFAIILAVAIQGRRPTLPDWVPRGLADLIAACWAENPRARPTAAQVYARLDALIAEELGRRAVRAARVGVSRPRVSRHYGGSGAALVPMASASSSGLSHRETNAAASMDVSTAGVHALPSPPPSPSMLPTPPALVSQSSSQPPQSQDSAGGGKGEAAAVPAPVSRGNERHDSYIPSSGSSAAIAAAAAARRPLQLSPRPRSGSTAVAELPLGSQLAPYIDPHPELLPGGELQLPQPPRSPDAAGRLARRQQLPRPPPSPPGRTALHPEPMSPRLDLPLPDYSKGSPKLQPVPPNLPPPPPLRPQDSSLPHRHQQEEQSEPPSKAPVPATSGSGRAGRSFAQMAAAVFGAATGGRGTSGSWFGGNSSATTTAGSVSASGGEEAALPPARGASRRVSPSLASPLAEPAPAALPLPPLQSDQRPRRSMGPLPAEVGAQAGLAAVAASALPSTASTSTQTSDSLDRSLSGLDALVNTTWTDGDVEGGRAVRAEAGPASEERRQRAALALRRSEAGAGAKAEDAADAAELAGRFFSARSRHDPQTSEDYCTVTEDEADTGEDSGPAGGSNGAPRRRRGSRHRSVQANTEDGGDGAGTSSGAVRGRSAAASPIGSSGGSASRSALWHGSDAHQPQQSLQHARMLASQPALYGAARLRDAADAAERGAVGDSAVAMGGRVGRGGEGGVAGMGRELTAGEGVSAPTGPGDCDGHHHRPLSGSHPQSSVSDDTGGGDDGGGQVNRSTGGGGGDGGGSLSGNVARWWPWWLFRRPTGDQQVAQAPQAQGSGPAARPQEGQPETHLAAGAHLRQPPARHAHRGPQHAYNQYPGNHRHPHQSSWNPEPEPPSRQPQPHPGHSRTVSTPCPAAAGSWPWPQSPAQQVQYHAAHLNGAAGAGQGVDGVGIPGDGGSGGGSGGTDAAPSVCGTGEPGPSRTTTDYTVASTRTLSSNAGLPYPYPYSPSAQPPSYRYMLPYPWGSPVSHLGRGAMAAMSPGSAANTFTPWAGGSGPCGTPASGPAAAAGALKAFGSAPVFEARGPGQGQRGCQVVGADGTGGFAGGVGGGAEPEGEGESARGPVVGSRGYGLMLGAPEGPVPGRGGGLPPLSEWGLGDSADSREGDARGGS